MFSTIIYVLLVLTGSFIAFSFVISIEEKFFGRYPKSLPESAKVKPKLADKDYVSRD